MPGAARGRGLCPPAGELMGTLLWLSLWVPAALAEGRWCERTERVTEEEVVSPRREQAVPCAEMYHYNLAGWRIDQHRMRQAYGGDYAQAGPTTSLCYIYKPPDTRPVVWNRTVRACCEGWSGPHCTQSEGFPGLCFSTWQCQAGLGTWNLSLLSMAECCGRPWGRSWKNSSSELCLSCSALPLPGDLPAPFLLRPLPPAALLGLPRPRHRLFATCVTWAGFHYRSFDGKHFYFHGDCTYSLAAASDGTWAVDISGSGTCTPPHCHRALRMLFGLDLVVAQGRNVSVNGAVVLEGEPLLQDGISVRWLGDFVFVESGLGVRVKSDGRDTVYVTVSRELRGTTRGLCGLYDDDPADDFLKAGGDVATFAASFGNSWRVPDASPELPCQDAAEAGHSCDVAEASAVRQEAEAVCRKLLASPFSQCHSEVDPGGFYDACMYASCQHGGAGAGRREAVCATFASYARDCAQQHVYVDWRRPGFCEKQCGQGKQYSDCVSSCPASCAAVGTGEEGHCRDECVSGCECPPGLYLEGGACVPEGDCPCYHRRQKYAPGQSIRQRCNQCTCQGGRWHCSQDKCSAECAVIGDPHYVTFDQKRYSFHGVCEYILVQDFVDWKLLITAEKMACGSQGAVSCLQALTVTVHRTSARLRTTGDVAVNGQEVALPFASADLSIRRASSSFLLLQAFGAHVLWGLELPAAYITLQPGFAGKVRGLCGTYNWNQQDEFTTPAGDVEPSVAAFANKFRASSECPTLGSFAFDPCGTYAQHREFAEAACAVLHSSAFQPCHDLVEREPYYQLCLYDVCGCAAGGDCLCSALAAYARQCAQEGTPVPWRNQTFCAVPCSGGQVYQECSAPCRKSCAELRLGEASSCQALALCVAGCTCPEGLVLDDSGQCVPPGMCPCEHGGETYPPGSTIHRSCNACVCVNGLWNCTDDSCPEAAFCPGELVYAYGSCLRTCATAEGNLSCPGLSAGCVCPPGTVLLNERCISPDECPCHHNGRLYQPNDTIAKDCNTCVCRSRRWQCSSHHCAGTCVATGDPHYVTFDGRAFSFLGDCEYVLAREGSGLFTVTSENVPCGTSGVTCTKSVVVVIGNTVVHLLRGKDVTVNGVSVRPPKTYSGNGLTLERAGVFLILISQLGLSVLWDGGTRVYVKLEPRYQGRVAGLCGNFDGDTENDFTSRQGVVEPTSDLFGNSWRVSLLCPEVNNEDFEHPCTANAHRGTWARKRCSIIMQHLFAPCHEEVPCQQFYDWCVFDACGCDSGGDCECLCTAIAAYAEECNQRGVYVRWRSQELCPMQCDNGLEYEACGPACPQTCTNFGLEPPEHCDAISCVEGCFCPDGRVLHDGSCIDPAECPCFWEGISFPVGAVVKQECKNCTCEAGLWQCDAPAEPCLVPPRCPEAEFACRTGGRCVPSAWVCDNEDDCGDGSDEFCVPSCAPQQYQCASGQCVAWGYRCDGAADCLDHSDERDCPAPGCAQQEFRCANGRCIPRAHVCDGELDCGFADESDEAGCSPPCGAGEFGCAAGRCLPYLQRCDGHDDCGDFSDERECVCPPGDFQCPDALCLPPALVCDGKRDCPAGTDESFCPGRVTCAPGQLPCPDGSCVSRTRVCDGAWDCGDGSDESPARCLTARPSPLPTALPVTLLPPANRTAAPPCGRYEFHCGSGECRPRGWVCDDEADCLDGSDELVCNRTCGLDQHTCAVSAECIPYGQLCDGIPQCRDQSDESTDNCGSTEIPPCPGLFVCNNRMCVNVSRVCDGSHDCPQGEDELACEHHVPPGERNQTVGPCTEYSCAVGKCIPFKQVCNGLADCADGSEASGWLPSDERDCGLWSPWAPWSTCSRSCGTGLQIRRRVCTRRANDVLRHCHGEETQAQQCFALACPVDGAWSEWATWANCTQDCRGVVVRRRECIAPRNGGRHCSELPGASPSTLEIKPCQLEGCLNATACPAGLARRLCAPCPMSCADLASKGKCKRDRPCSPGCWCPEGLVLDSEQQCVRPRECPCLVEGVRHWPGQLVKVNCRICACQDGQMKRCRQNPECTVNCGWSAWSPWGECLGPCGVQSIQWSFRSPNNPSKHGNGRQCRGIYRKARRCQTDPCEECEHHGRSHPIGDRWRSGQCQVCQCLPNLTVQCSQYCPYSTVGCPEGRALVEGRGEACCYCAEVGENRTSAPAVQTAGPPGTTLASPAASTSPPLVTFPLPPLGDRCYGPLGLASLPDSCFTASSQQPENPAHAGRLNHVLPGSDLQGWGPQAEVYHELLSKPPYLQVDLLEPRNLTGVVVQGAGSSDAYVTSFLLQFSTDGLRWHEYREVSADAQPEPKLFLGNADDSTPVVRTFQRMVRARHVRILPHDFHHGIFLRAELLGCERVPPGAPTAPPGRRPCRTGEFQCRNGRCVPAGPRGAVCNGLDDCGDFSDELRCGTAPSVGPSAPWRCPLSHFHCALSDGCIDAFRRCDGVADCPDGTDEAGCGVPPAGTASSWAPGQPSPPTEEVSRGTEGWQFPGDVLPTPTGPCSEPLGLDDGRIRYQQLSASSHRDSNPPDAGRLNMVPNILNIEPGWSPLETDRSPYFQVDFLRPTFVSALVTQGGPAAGGYVTRYRLQYSHDGVHYRNYTGAAPGAAPPQPAQVLQGNFDSHTPVQRELRPLILARYLRLLPVEYHRSIHLRMEALGCPWSAAPLGTSPTAEQPPLPTATPVPGSRIPSTVNESSEAKPTGQPEGTAAAGKEPGTPTLGTTGPAGDTRSPGAAGPEVPHLSTARPWWGTGTPGLVEESRRSGAPGVASPEPRRPGETPTAWSPGTPGLFWAGTTSLGTPRLLGPTLPGMAAVTVSAAGPGPGPTGLPGLHTGPSQPGRPGLATTLAGLPFPRLLCTQGQFACEVLGCVEAAFVCDGQEDCLDGSDEWHCGGPTSSAVPTATLASPTGRPSACSAKQFSCGSGECVALEKRCDLYPDCQDGSDESSCVDCILSSWSGWSECSRSCGLGVTFRRRDLLRNALPGGQCERNEFDSRSCFLRACPVNGAWAPWGEWSDCDAECRGGVRSRTRSCADPPPKNGGQPCPGDAVQTEPCNLQPCGDARDCGPEMVHVQAEDCERGLVAPCPQSCRELNAERSCQSHCVEGCRCPPGLYLQEGSCVNISQCHCDFSHERRLPGEMFLHDNCSQCVCLDGVVTCDDLACPVNCGWSAWSPWTPCDRSCGVGMRERFRSPTNPAPANSGAPCEGDAQQVRECHTACVSEPTGPWSDWTPWSPCSKTCFYDVDRVGVRKRFRHCNDTGEGAGRCQGVPVEEEQCDTPPCPVGGVWTPWTAWSRCSATCDSGVQTRSRTCSNPAYGGPECTGPLVQTRDCNSQPCRALCPAPMIYQTAEECRRGGGACPRLCLDQGAGVECATRCYPGCYCPDGLFLQNDSCVPRSQCLCYHQGALYQPGDTAPHDTCNNCTCVAGEMECGTEPCPVHCGWGGWTEWSSCSRSCNVGTRRRYRSGSDPPAAFGGRNCQGPGVEVEFCSLQPCRGSGAEWGPWSECSVPCGGGYQNRTRGSTVLHRIEFTTCNLQPCAGEVPGVCPEGKLWQECADAPASCAELGTEPPADRPCHAGCYCPPGTVLLNNRCVAESECPCAEGGVLYAPGDVVPKGCENCSCEAGRISNCSRVACGDVTGGWSDWTPWSECSASCGLGLQTRYRFCTAPPPSGTGLPCLGPEREEQPCHVQPCSRSGGWSAWSSWTECTKSCGEGLRSRARACDSPAPLGHGDYCEGPPAQVEACHPGQCPALDCAAVQGSMYSRCGPSCPRSCDDISHCLWSCEPGCYCTSGRVLNANSSACVERQDCTCLDLLTQERYLPGETVAHQDGCNNCTCTRGALLCTSLPCPVAGGWCDWSPWTPCSRTCGSEVVTRYRACACPTPQHGGAECAGAQERHGDTGTQLQHKECPSAAFCPVDGGWSSWGPWSACAACIGESTRRRECSSPPARFGGMPCPGEARQSRACHDGDTVCEGCGGGQVAFACGKPCPRSCEDLQADTACLDSPQCQHSCGCPAGRLLQDGACVSLAQCRCKYHNGSLEAPEPQPLSAWAGPVPWKYAQPGQTVYGPCQNCTCEDGHLQCRADPACRLDGGWGAWGPWSPCPQRCQEGPQFRFRECENPAPQHGGRGCTGDSQQQRACHQGEPPCREEAPWSDWSPWAPCSVSCGGGEQIRTRQCHQPACQGLAVQSKTCHTQVCLEVGCPAGRLYRECLQEEGCPYSCAHLTRQMDCFSDGCEEGCHCPAGTYQHHGACVQECPCLVTEETLQELQNHSANASARPAVLTAQGRWVSLGQEVQPHNTIRSACSTCTCHNGQLNCSFTRCPLDGGFAPWSPWTPCSVSCGGLGHMTRARGCTSPPPANGGKDCVGPRTDIKYCQTLDCPVTPGPTKEPVPSVPGSEEGFSLWSPWSPCSKTCTDPEFPATKTRTRGCAGGANCTGESFQERACNLPQCTDAPPCLGEECAGRNCTWTPWAPWSECSRSCGVGQQQRLRTYHPPGERGLWCQGILTANTERRFCNLQACKASGWSLVQVEPVVVVRPHLRGGRSVRTRTCTSPPPKNGGARCPGEKYQGRVCNPRPCEEGCPPAMAMVDCANRCPRHCWDLQEGITCQDGEACEPGCRCPDGTLEQDGACVSPQHCECTDAQGHSWAPGSLRHDGCNNCTCSEGRLLCTHRTCPPSQCDWSHWSRWSPCSVTCGDGLQTRFRTATSGSWARECQKEQLQTRPCPQGPCPPLCPHQGWERRLGDTWLLGECQQCICTPEGIYCQDIACAVHGSWTPWSPWSDCPVTCGNSTHVRTRACINPPPRNNGSACAGPEAEAQGCAARPCPAAERCDWSVWSPCSRSCGTGLATRTGTCACPSPEGPSTPCNDSARQEVEPCYLRPCEGDCSWSPWTPWTQCSCSFLVQQRYRNQRGPGPQGALCVGLDGEFRACDSSQCSEANCEPPFEFRECGIPCAGLCSTLQRQELCTAIPRCLPGCYCPQGLVEQRGTCVPPAQCGCLHLRPGEGPVYLAAGDTVLVGCKECVCQEGTLQCSSESCQGLLPLSEWSAWTPCTSCLPLSALSPGTLSVLLAQHGGWQDSGHPQLDIAPLASVQHRYRVCLDPQTGLPWAGEAALCSAELQQERLCPNPHHCEDLCLWSEWSPWGPCREPCSGGFRLRRRHVQHPAEGRWCWGARVQSESCNTAACPGEECEDRGKEHAPTCANRCPRTCADLWEHVECLQGECKPGCRCPEGQLLQDGVCVPVLACRCGLPTANSTRELWPGQAAELDCHNCTCGNGTFACPDPECPSYGPWSEWSPCSVTCGGGSTLRHRACQESPAGAPCTADAMEEIVQCNLQPCPAGCQLSPWSAWSPCSASCGGGVSERTRSLLSPGEGRGEQCPAPLLLHRACHTHNCTPECPGPQVYSDCANACPRTCSDLRPGTECLREECQPGCACPPGQVLQDGACAPPEECRCSLVPAPAVPWASNLSQEERAREYPAGSTIHHQCNSCVCRRGTFSCSQQDCNVDCLWSAWSAWSACSVTCGPGVRISQRHQLQQRLYAGAECLGPPTRRTPCSLPDCACPTGERWRGPGPTAPCERTCQQIYEEPQPDCSVGAVPGCVCEAGRYRNSSGHCVTAAHCECEHGGQLRPPGAEWQEACESCRCLNGRAVCTAGCPPLFCLEGEVKVQEPGSCCPVCRRESFEEPLSACQRYTEVRNITKGRCALHGVEVSYCSGRCASRTNVISEEPYLQTLCDCCSYHLDPVSPVRILSLPCEDGEVEPVVLPVIHSCECSPCQSGDFSER